MNTLLIVFDELINYDNLPDDITDKLRGYQAFKKMGIEFLNIQTSRQQCTPSRSTLPTGIMNTGLQDNIDYNYQYDYIPKLPPALNTIAKEYKYNGYDHTVYYGKQHLDAKLSETYSDLPLFATNTTGAMKQYGYDKFNVYGDTYYYRGHGMIGDTLVMSHELSPNSIDYDYIDKNGNKFAGILPFLNARKDDGTSFYAECHITNPHDTNHMWQNLAQTPASQENQFDIPFIREQLQDSNVSNPYYYSFDDTNAVVNNPNLVKNYFEKYYDLYSDNELSLPFLESFTYDYATSSKVNTLNPFYVGTYYALEQNMTMPNDQSDMANWKNLINNYYGLLFEADSYLYKIYQTLCELDLLNNINIIIIADHGDQMSAHGLKQKQVPFKECSNIPCIICSPKIDSSLKGTKSLLYGSLIDIAPTQVALTSLNLKEDSFIGKSLLTQGRNGLVPNAIEHDNYMPFNYVNSTMYNINYFPYLLWKYKNADEKLIYYPQSYYDFQSSFQSIITTVNGVTYKYGRYFSLLALIKYNFDHNDKINSLMRFGLVFDDGFITKKLSKLISKNTVSNIISLFRSLLKNVFSFDEGLEIIENFVGNNFNNFIYYIYMGSVLYYMSATLQYDFIIPGSITSWNTNYNNRNMNFFMYDLSNDPNEIKNLLDPKHVDAVPTDTHDLLNNLLNIRISETEMTDSIFIVPDKALALMIYYMFIIGGIIIENFTDEITVNNLFTFLGGTTSLDTKLSNKKIQEINKTISLYQTSLGQQIKYANPYTIYDKSGESDYIYVGEREYIINIFSTKYPNLKFTEPVMKKGYDGTGNFISKDVLYNAMAKYSA